MSKTKKAVKRAVKPATNKPTKQNNELTVFSMLDEIFNVLTIDPKNRDDKKFLKAVKHTDYVTQQIVGIIHKAANNPNIGWGIVRHYLFEADDGFYWRVVNNALSLLFSNPPIRIRSMRDSKTKCTVESTMEYFIKRGAMKPKTANAVPKRGLRLNMALCKKCMKQKKCNVCNELFKDDYWLSDEDISIKTIVTFITKRRLEDCPYRTEQLMLAK